MQVRSREHAVVANVGSLTLTIARPFGISLGFIYRISVFDMGISTSESKALTELVEASVGRLRIRMAEKSGGSETSKMAAPSPNLAQAPQNSRFQLSVKSSS